MSTGSMSAVRLALLAGLGIARVPQFVVADDLRSGALVQLMPEVPLPLSPANRALPARDHAVRGFEDADRGTEIIASFQVDAAVSPLES